VCDLNTGDTITTALSSIIEIKPPNEIKIKEEDTPTGGHFKFDYIKIVTAPNSTSTTVIKYNYPINVISSLVITEEQHRGDNMSWYVMPNTTVGALGASYTALTAWADQAYVVNDTAYYNGANYRCIVNTTTNQPPSNTTYWTKTTLTLTVSPTVVSYTSVGYKINLFDGVNSYDVGYITAKNSTSSTITVDGAPPVSYSAASPTYVRMTVAYVDNVEIGPPMSVEIGAGKIGTSYLPAGVAIIASYTNKSSTDTKTLYSFLQYLY
jgi:hypothetical protein